MRASADGTYSTSTPPARARATWAATATLLPEPEGPSSRIRGRASSVAEDAAWRSCIAWRYRSSLLPVASICLCAW